MICIDCKIEIKEDPIQSDFGVFCSEYCESHYSFFDDTANIFMFYSYRNDLNIAVRSIGYGNGYMIKPEHNMRVWRKLKRAKYQKDGFLTDKGMNVLSHLQPELKRILNLLETKTEKELRAME